jgi:RNA polymerase sigma-70 factor (ECF subfamily)
MRIATAGRPWENHSVVYSDGVSRDVDQELAALLRRLASGETAALEGVWDLVADELYGFARWCARSPADADDVVQETFVRLVRFAREAAHAERPKAYLLTIVRRVAIDLQRRRRDETLGDAPLLVARSADPVQVLDAARASRLVGRLPRKQRETVYLRHFAGLTFDEMGRVLGVPTFTAASRYRVGMAALRRWMGLSS